MGTDLSRRIKANEIHFSKGQRLISRFITEHYEEAADMTAAKLGIMVGVSESTVVRFATQIGYSGYPELQNAMQDLNRNKLTTVQRLDITSKNIPFKQLLDSSVGQDIDSLKRSLENISRENFYNVSSEVAKCDNVYILGSGSSFAIATFLRHYFSLIFDKVTLIEATSEATIFQQLLKVKENDAVIGISFPRYSKKVVKALQFATDKNACSLAITDSEFSPIAKVSKNVLFAKSDMASFVDSMVAPLSLVNALIVSVAIQKKDTLATNLKMLEDIWEEYAVYEKIEEKSEN